MAIHQLILKRSALYALLIISVILGGCGNKSELYMPGESPQDMAIKKKKEQIKSNEIISPSINSEEVKSKYYEKEADEVQVISHPKNTD